MFILGLYGLVNSFFAYQKEFAEDFNSHLTILLYTCQLTSIFETVVLFFRFKMTIKLAIMRHEAHVDSEWHDVLNWKETILEFIFT